MAIQLRARGVTAGRPGRVLGRATRLAVPEAVRGDYLRVLQRGAIPQEKLAGYAAVLCEGAPTLEVDD